MSYSTATLANRDCRRGTRRLASAGRSEMVPSPVGFAYLRNLPADYPNALAAPGRSPTVMKQQMLLLMLLLCGCLLLRFVGTLGNAGICPDGVMYIRLAAALDEGHYQEAFSCMELNVYPPILLALHHLGLPWETAGQLWGIVMSSLVVLPLFGFVRRQFDDVVATVCCLLYAVHPIFFQWSTELIRDQTFWFLFACTLYCQWRAVTGVRWRHFFAAGMAMTLAVLTRFEGLFLLIPLLLWTVRRYRDLTEKPLRRKLIAGTTLAVAAFPIFIVLVNAIWLSRHHQWVFSRLSPLTMFAEWIRGLFSPVTAPLGLPEEMQSPSFLRLVEIYVPALVKGLTPLFAVPLLIGMWKWRRLWARRDHQTLFYTSLMVMAAAWVHAWCGRESCDRYYLPIVLMGSPFAALGILAVCRRFLLWSERISARKMFVRLAVAAPLALVLLGNSTIAFSSNDNRRQAEVELAKWIRQEYGPVATILGSEGITPVIAYYSGAKHALLMKVMDDQAALDLTREYHPDVILILATRRNDFQETQNLIDKIVRLGFCEIDRNRLPPGTDCALTVLGREKGKTKK